MEILRSKTGRILIEAHHAVPSQSGVGIWAALEDTLRTGVDLLEVDVYRLKDGSLLIYDGYLLPDGRCISDMTSHELESLKLLGHSIVYLREVLDWAACNYVGLSLDIKNELDLEPRAFLDTVSMVDKCGMIDRVMLVAWDHVGLRLAKKANPQINTRASIRCRPVDLLHIAKTALANVIGLPIGFIRRDQFEELHNDEIGVAGIMRDHIAYPSDLLPDLICCNGIEDIRLVQQRQH